MITVQLSEGPAGYIADPQGLLAQTNEIGQSQKDCISYPPPPTHGLSYGYALGPSLGLAFQL